MHESSINFLIAVFLKLNIQEDGVWIKLCKLIEKIFLESKQLVPDQIALLGLMFMYWDYHF